MQVRPIGIDGRALAVTMGAVVFCTVLAALPPAWRMARGEIGLAMRESERALVGGQHRLRAGLVGGGQQLMRGQARTELASLYQTQVVSQCHDP